MEKAIVTCALTGVLTNPAQHPVPVSPEEMAQAAKDAFNAGASVMHIHFRNQAPNMGYLPTWDPKIADEISSAIREACPGVLLNFSTGVFGKDISGPVSCLERCKPEIAAMNSGSLNYLKLRRNGDWAWPPMLFDNPVDKVSAFLKVMYDLGIAPECECFDTGILRSIAMFKGAGLLRDPVHVSLVMGVASAAGPPRAWVW